MNKNNWLVPVVFTGLAINTINNKLFSHSKDKLRKRELKHKLYNWKFGTINYNVTGSGEPILLIHDTFSGSSSIEFDRVIHQLSKKHKVYALDLLGYGYSERANITYTAYLYVQLITEFIHDIIEQEQITVITSGNSNIFALLSSQQETNLISKLIMLNPSDLRIAALNPSSKDNTIKYFLELPFVGTTLYNLLHSRVNFKALFNDTKSMQSLEYYIDQFYHNAHYDNSNTRYSFASNMSNYMNMDIREVIQNSNISIYVINGEHRSTDYQIIEDQYTTYNPSIECSHVKTASDLPHLENPYSTYDFIQLYLQD